MQHWFGGLKHQKPSLIYILGFYKITKLFMDSVQWNIERIAENRDIL